jgi:hypothetical protein
VFGVVGSGSLAVTDTVLLIGPVAIAKASIVIAALAPTASVPTVHDPLQPVVVHEPPNASPASA